jgi:hypothetical protein
MRSESTVFLGQPRETKAKVRFVESAISPVQIAYRGADIAIIRVLSSFALTYISIAIYVQKIISRIWTDDQISNTYWKSLGNFLLSTAHIIDMRRNSFPHGGKKQKMPGVLPKSLNIRTLLSGPFGYPGAWQQNLERVKQD